MGKIDLKALKAPFKTEQISWRVGATTGDDNNKKGIALAYIDVRDLYQRLDEVCQPEKWQIRYPQANGKTTCEIGIKVDDEWLWKANGAGDTDVEGAKGAYSDAAKRAGVPWGIGAYLYDMPNVWVKLKKQGRSWVIQSQEMPQLHKAHEELIGNGFQPNQVFVTKTDKETWKRNAFEEMKIFESADDVTNWTNENIKKIGALTKEEQDKMNEHLGKLHNEFLDQQAAMAAE